MKLFAVLDVKANYFLKPIVDESTVNALRSFDVATNEAGSTFNRFPDDFALFEFGSFDGQTGKFDMHPSPVNLSTARALLRSAVTEVRQ